MILGEYGNKIRIWAQEDISTYENKLVLISPPPVVLEKEFTPSNGLVVGSADLDVDGVIYKANEYVELEFEINDVMISGTWEAQLHSLTPEGKMKKIKDLSFEIEND